MNDPALLLAVLIRARRSGDWTAETDALTRLAHHGYRVFFGDALSPPRHRNPHETPTGRPRQASP